MSTSRPRVLVIYKRSNYQRFVQERKNRRIAQLIAEGHKTVDQLEEAHDAHWETVQRARGVLRELGVRAAFRYLRTKKKSSEEFDLIVTLGGDGTLLWASHMVTDDRPMVGINTAPRTSVGYFCAGDSTNLAETLAAAVEQRLETTLLTRMAIELDGKVVSRRVLNDILFCHEIPAATTRYIVRHKKIEEEHKSSGVWVGPPAGSTAALRSAGGRVLPIGSHRLQWVVREPYVHGRDRYALDKGLVEPDEDLRLWCKIPEGRIYVDGPHRVLRVPFGCELRMYHSDQPLTLLGLRRRTS